MKRNLTFILLVIAMVGCATIPIHPIVKEKVMVADFDSTWQATLQALQEGKFPVEYVDEESGIIQTRKLQVKAGVLKSISQGYRGIFSQPSEGEYNLKVRVRPRDQDRTSVRIDAHIRANFPEHGWYQKSSSGIMEDRIFSNIMKRLAQHRILHKWF